MLSAIALILAFQVVGEVISRSAGIPVPGPVIGMILMLLAFFVKGVMRYGDLFLREGLAIGAVLVISTLIAMLVTAYTIIFVDKLVHKNKNKNKD